MTKSERRFLVPYSSLVILSSFAIRYSSFGAETNDIRALKGPVAVPADYERYLWIPAILFALAAALFWRRFLRRLVQRLIGDHTLSSPPLPPHVRARQKLAAALAHISDPKLFCSEVSDTIRFYLEERFEFHAPERTTEEFLVELQGSRLLNEEQKDSLAAFLQSCDLAKFARFEPTESALHELHDSALRLVDETQFTPVREGRVATPFATAAVVVITLLSVASGVATLPPLPA